VCGPGGVERGREVGVVVGVGAHNSEGSPLHVAREKGWLVESHRFMGAGRLGRRCVCLDVWE
jgi:hypothetical protein